MLKVIEPYAASLGASLFACTTSLTAIQMMSLQDTMFEKTVAFALSVCLQACLFYFSNIKRRGTFKFFVDVAIILLMVLSVSGSVWFMHSASETKISEWTSNSNQIKALEQERDFLLQDIKALGESIAIDTASKWNNARQRGGESLEESKRLRVELGRINDQIVETKEKLKPWLLKQEQSTVRMALFAIFGAIVDGCGLLAFYSGFSISTKPRASKSSTEHCEYDGDAIRQTQNPPQEEIIVLNDIEEKVILSTWSTEIFNRKNFRIRNDISERHLKKITDRLEDGGILEKGYNRQLVLTENYKRSQAFSALINQHRGNLGEPPKTQINANEGLLNT